MVPVNELSVFSGEHLLGTIHDTDPLSFSYAKEWLEPSRPDHQSYALPGIPLQVGRVNTPAVEAVFENLLPEGILRDLLGKQTKSSTTFSFLLAVAGDTAGGLTILPAGSRPEPPSYKAVDWDAISQMFSGGLQSRSATAPMGSRISLSGAQAKLLISVDESGQPLLPLGSTPSTWIVKPNIRGFEGVWNSAVNEAIIMRMGAHCGLGVAEVFYEPVTAACVVKRFDRIVREDGKVDRLRQFDFCQLSGITSGKKYESEGGPSLIQCAETIRAHSAKPAADLMRFLQWILFNLYTGNNDSHAKNLSLYQLPGEGMRLTPFYDLMDTRLYPGLSASFAFLIGGESRPGKLERDHLLAMASELKLKPSFIIDLAKTMHAKIGPALNQAIAEIGPTLGHSERALADKLRQHVTTVSNKNAQRLIGAGQVEKGEETLEDPPPSSDRQRTDRLS